MKSSHNPFHEGEIKIQELTGDRLIALANGSSVKDEILTAALSFVERQPLAVVASRAADGSLWSSVLFGRPGFVRAVDTHEVRIDLNGAHLIPGDPVLQNLQDDPRVGMLMIELDTRRRLKINGDIVKIDAAEIVIAVRESFPLCPKYIQRRKVRLPADLDMDAMETGGPVFGTVLGAAEKAIITSADTLFCATANPHGHLDLSHRGGRPGFARIIGDTELRIPDFAGNGMFNSFGNLQLDDHTGVIAIDFASRQVLQMSGRAQVLLNEKDPDHETGGTNRFWTLQIESWQRSVMPAVELEFYDYSPFNP